MKKNTDKTVRKHTLQKALLLLFAVLFTLFPGCTNSGNNPVLPYFHLDLPSEEPVSASEEPSEPENPEAYIYDSQWTPPTPLPDYESGKTPEIHNERELDYYMEYILANRIQTFYFYACDGFTIDNDLLLYRYSLPYVSTSETVENDNRSYWYVYLEYYPGVLIADAYKSGNPAGLSDDEFEVYEKAAEYIETFVNPEENLLVKERLIHDYICDHATYSNPPAAEAVPRHCTAVGLFLDGEANCQGYTDAFNMLATMAGFEVQSQTGYAEGSRHVWNIIRVYGKWYIMDVTYDDTTFFEDGSGYPAYIYFNCGMDFLNMNHEIIEGNHELRVRKESDENYFYYSDQFPDSGFLHENGDAVKDIAALLDLSNESGASFVSYYVPDETLYADVIVNPVYNATAAHRPVNINIYHLAGNSFICAY